jgi:RimJ/RimL family protein N-acetyltransferase
MAGIMPGTPMLETPRLLLRRWRESDRETFHRMNADPRVMEFFPACLTRSESDALIDRIEAHMDRYGFGLYAAQLRETAEFIGFVGMGWTPFEAHFTPCVEIGWRLGSAYWSRGLATEGARECLRYGFETLELPEVVAMTVGANVRSRRVMEKLGMTCDSADSFEHPRVPLGHRLRKHVLYRVRRDGGASRSSALNPTASR